MKRILLAWFILSSCLVRADEFVWFDGSRPVTYSVSRTAAPVVGVALELFRSDLRQVTGLEPITAPASKATIRIVELDKASATVRNTLKKSGVPVDELTAKPDGFYVAVNNGQLWVVGSNGRGTAYGLLELSRMAGVSPWVWWGDVTPERRTSLSVASDFRTLQSPSVEYRGIFLNDEDWSLQPWSWKTFEPGPYGLIGAKTYRKIFELLLRLRANAIWPAMHGGSVPFYFVEGAKEAADSCGIVIGTSHCEPLLRNNVGEWDIARRGPYNYITNRDSVLSYWAERLKEARNYQNLYTIGMRGIHDGSMEGVKTLDEKTEALQRVIGDQRRLLEKHLGQPADRIPQVFLPYKEVLDIMENGLEVPDDVTLMWCDDNYGYLTRLSDSLQQQRSGGAGVYYHLSYWGRPHDYLWLTTTQPGLIYNEMRQAYDHNARRVWIVNVHDVKVAAYDLELVLDMAWNIDAIRPDGLNDHLERWLCRQFGDTAGKRLFPAMREFYRLCGIRKPEHMGWTQVELDRSRYPRGRSQVIDTEFSFTEFGSEADRYMEQFEAIRRTVAEAEKHIDSARRDAFFAAVKYPVEAAAAMSVKMLEAQRARSCSQGQCDTSLWNRDSAMYAATAKSLHAYRKIRTLTDHYNDTMADGKWRGLMCAYPRDLYVFYPPTIPVGLTDEEVTRLAGDAPTPDAHPLTADRCIARNACDWTSASDSVHTIQMLGHSMAATVLPQDTEVVYAFDSEWEGDALLRMAVIPTQPNDKGDIRFSVRIDDGEEQIFSFREKGRTDTWKLNVLRGQAIKTLPLTLTKGRHTLTVRALDPHVVLDQWMVDFRPDRKFYVFPVEPASADPLAGKRIGVLGDSYVRNHKEPVERTWHYKFAAKHGMEYYNYGRNGSCVAIDRERFGPAMYKRYKEMRDSLDYVVVIGGHNDATLLDTIGLDNYKEKLALLCEGLIEKYPAARICFFTRWTCKDFAGSDSEKIVDATIEVCGRYGIPVFDAARRSNISAEDDAFRAVYFQGGGKTDTAHLNDAGHDLFLPVAERFLLAQ